MTESLRATRIGENLPKNPAAAFPAFFSASPEQYPLMNPYDSRVGTPVSIAPWICCKQWSL